MNWGHGVAAAFILFAGYIIYLVVGCFSQNIDLVSENYYAEEVAYQSRIQDIQNAKPFENQITVTREGESVIVQFPEGLSTLVNEGSVHFFRPSDETKDVMVNLKQLNEGKLSIPASEFEAGRYEVQIQWQIQDQGYFIKKNLFV